MEKLFNPAVIWFLIGFVFLVLEFLVPGFILFFFAAGAWIVAILCLIGDPSINTQLFVFLGASLLTTVLFRKSVKRMMTSGKPSSEIMEDEFLGRQALVEISIAPGKDGKVEFRGTSWDARSDVYIEKGQLVTIVGNESILLIVKPTNP